MGVGEALLAGGGGAADGAAPFGAASYGAGAGAELLTAPLPDQGCMSDDAADAAADAAEDVEGRVAPFLVKLYEIVNSKALEQHITWNAAGDTLRIVDPAAFARDVLPLYFKHSNLRSFIRQLNMYGFYRGPNKGVRVIEFFHERFCRGGRAQLKRIKRCHVTKAKAKSAAEHAASTPAAAAAQAQSDSEMEGLLGDLGSVHHYICKLEEELMGHIVQLHSKLARILHKLELPAGGGAAIAAAAVGCCASDMMAHATAGGGAPPPAYAAAAASDAAASSAGVAASESAGAGGAPLQPAAAVLPIAPMAFAAAASAAERCNQIGAAAPACRVGGGSSSVACSFGCGAAPATPCGALPSAGASAASASASGARSAGGPSRSQCDYSMALARAPFVPTAIMHATQQAAAEQVQAHARAILQAHAQAQAQAQAQARAQAQAQAVEPVVKREAPLGPEAQLGANG